jgi:hypothetical protein
MRSRLFRSAPSICSSVLVGVLIAGPSFSSLSCNKEENGSGPGPMCTDCTPTGVLSARLPSPAGAVLWTAPTMDKILREAAPPSESTPHIQLYAARNEFEPFQLAVRADAAGSATLSMTPFMGSGMSGTIDRIEIRRVGYVRIQQPSDASSIMSSAIPDPLEPTSFGASESLPAMQNQPFWITVYVPENAAPGDYTSTLTVRIGAAAQEIPVRLHVYGFALPKRIGFDGQWNASFQRSPPRTVDE